MRRYVETFHMSYIAVRQLLLSVLELAMEMALDYANAYEDMRQQYVCARCCQSPLSCNALLSRLQVFEQHELECGERPVWVPRQHDKLL